MTLAENYFDELEYYNSVDQKTLSSMQREYGIVAGEVVNNLYRLSQNYQDSTAITYLNEELPLLNKSLKDATPN